MNLKDLIAKWTADEQAKAAEQQPKTDEQERVARWQATVEANDAIWAGR